MNVEERTLDWVPKWDPESNRFMVSQLNCFAIGSHRPSISRKKTIWLDQGREGACTGFGTAHVLSATPKPNPKISTADAQGIYYEARRQDEWAGEDYEGSSVNGAMRAARLQKRIVSWHWCVSISEVRHALSYHGPLAIGVNWYTGMFRPDASGVIHVTGRVEGGHCLMLSGYKDGMYDLDNSWGPSWGINGGCKISEADLQRLMSEQGEFACPKKAPVVA